MSVWKEEEGNMLGGGGWVRVRFQHAATSKISVLLIEKQNTRNRFFGTERTQPVAVIFLVFPHSSVRNFL